LRRDLFSQVNFKSISSRREKHTSLSTWLGNSPLVIPLLFLSTISLLLATHKSCVQSCALSHLREWQSATARIISPFIFPLRHRDRDRDRERERERERAHTLHSRIVEQFTIVLVAITSLHQQRYSSADAHSRIEGIIVRRKGSVWDPWITADHAGRCRSRARASSSNPSSWNHFALGFPLLKRIALRSHTDRSHAHLLALAVDIDFSVDFHLTGQEGRTDERMGKGAGEMIRAGIRRGATAW